MVKHLELVEFCENQIGLIGLKLLEGIKITNLNYCEVLSDGGNEVFTFGHTIPASSLSPIALATGDCALLWLNLPALIPHLNPNIFGMAINKLGVSMQKKVQPNMTSPKVISLTKIPLIENGGGVSVLVGLKLE